MQATPLRLGLEAEPPSLTCPHWGVWARVCGQGPRGIAPPGPGPLTSLVPRPAVGRQLTEPWTLPQEMGPLVPWRPDEGHCATSLLATRTAGRPQGTGWGRQ